MNEKSVERALNDGDLGTEERWSRDLVGYGGLIITGLVLSVFGVLATLIPSTVAAVGLGVSGVLVLITGIGGYMMKMVGEEERTEADD